MIKEITDPKYYFNVKAKKYIQKMPQMINVE